MKVWKRPSRKKSIKSKLNKPVWSNKCKNSMLSSSSNSNNRLSKMPRGTSRKSRETFTLKTRSLPKKRWVKDILSTITREKSSHSMVILRSSKEISSSSRVPLINMSKEDSLNKRKSKFLKKRLLFLRSLSNKLFMISKRRKSYSNSTMNRSSRTREKIFKIWEKVWGRKIRSLRILGLLRKSWLTKGRRLSSSSSRP